MNSDNKDTKAENDVRKEPDFKLPLWVLRKALKEDLSIEQLTVYWWIYKHNSMARGHRRDSSIVYGKRTYDAYQMEIKNEFGITRPDNSCSKLEEKGWIKKAHAAAFNGVRQVGYLCLLVEADRLQARAVQQRMQIDEEERVIEVESSLPDNGEYMQFGIRYYDDAEGNAHQVPTSAPPRPTNTAVWCSDPEGWFEPEEVPEHENEY